MPTFYAAAGARELYSIVGMQWTNDMMVEWRIMLRAWKWLDDLTNARVGDLAVLELPSP